MVVVCRLLLCLLVAVAAQNVQDIANAVNLASQDDLGCDKPIDDDGLPEDEDEVDSPEFIEQQAVAQQQAEDAQQLQAKMELALRQEEQDMADLHQAQYDLHMEENSLNQTLDDARRKEIIERKAVSDAENELDKVEKLTMQEQDDERKLKEYTKAKEKADVTVTFDKQRQADAASSVLSKGNEKTEAADKVEEATANKAELEKVDATLRTAADAAEKEAETRQAEHFVARMSAQLAQVLKVTHPAHVAATKARSRADAADQEVQSLQKQLETSVNFIQTLKVTRTAKRRALQNAQRLAGEKTQIYNDINAKATELEGNAADDAFATKKAAQSLKSIEDREARLLASDQGLYQLTLTNATSFANRIGVQLLSDAQTWQRNQRKFMREYDSLAAQKKLQMDQWRQTADDEASKQKQAAEAALAAAYAMPSAAPMRNASATL